MPGNCWRRFSKCDNPYCWPGWTAPGSSRAPAGVSPLPRPARLSRPPELLVLRAGLEKRDQGEGLPRGFKKTPAGRGRPRARPARRVAGGARGWAGLRVRRGPAAGTRRCARCLNEPGLPARATSREPGAGAATAGCLQRAGRRRPSGTRHGGLRRCARGREAAAAGDGDRAKLRCRAVIGAPTLGNMALEQLCAVLKGKRGCGQRPLAGRAALRRRLRLRLRLRALCLGQAARRRC